MIGMRVTKKMFFDSKAVMSAVNRATRRVLSRFGAFVRAGSKSSIRRRKRSSAPGRAPSNQTGLLKKFIFFGYDTGRNSVVIGPAKTNQLSVNASGGMSTGLATETLEYGGTVGIREVFKYGKWRRADMRSRRRLAGLQMRTRRVKIAARPYMGPAFEKEKPKLPAMWANSVK